MRSKEWKGNTTSFASFLKCLGCLFFSLWKVSQHCWFRAGRGDWAIMSFFPIPYWNLLLFIVKQGFIARAMPNNRSSAYNSQLRGFTLEFCFKHSANLTNRLFWRESTCVLLFFFFTCVLFDSAMIAQSFMVFVLKVDARFSNTKECLSEYYSKTSWVSIGLLI